MADQKITALDENVDPLGTDLLAMVDDPGVAPKTEKVPLATVFSNVPALEFVDGGEEVDIIRDEDNMASDDEDALATQQSIKAYVDAASGGVGGAFRNILINGDIQVAQRGTSFTAATLPLNSDDTYLLDRFVLLSDGNDIVDVTQSTDAPTGFRNSIKLEVETINKQFGILQIIEGSNCEEIIGSAKASISFYAKMAAGDDNTHSLKAVLLAWDNVEDTVTSDVINAWLATATFVANWTGENVPASNTLTTNWQRFEIPDIDVDTANTVNLALFIYCDQTDGAIDDAVFIAGIQVENGASVTDFEHLPFDVNLQRCLRYCYVMGGTSVNEVMMIGFSNIATVASVTLAPPVNFRTSPTIVVSNVAHIEVQETSNTFAITGLALVGVITSERYVYVDFTCGGGGLTAGRIAFIRAKNTVAAKLIFDAEL